jgi:hypothetical protein
MPAMIRYGKGKKIAEKLLGKPARQTDNKHEEPQTTGEQASRQMDNMWRNHVYTTLHD